MRASKVSSRHVMEKPVRGSVALWSFRGRRAAVLYAYRGTVCLAALRLTLGQWLQRKFNVYVQKLGLFIEM